MNDWTKKSIELANQTNYLDELFRVYPMSNNLKRELPEEIKSEIGTYFDDKDNVNLVKLLLKQELFPVKDSYVSYMRKDKGAVERNPRTVNRISGMLYEMGYHDILSNMTMPKETNRQIGPLFRNFIKQNSIGAKITSDIDEFLENDEDIILDLPDSGLAAFAKEKLGYGKS